MLSFDGQVSFIQQWESRDATQIILQLGIFLVSIDVVKNDKSLTIVMPVPESDSCVKQITAGWISATADIRRKVMALAVVWRNPLPPAGTQGKLQRVVAGKFGASYIVLRVDFAQEFELVLGGAA